MKRSQAYPILSYDERITLFINDGLLVNNREEALNDLANKNIMPYVWYIMRGGGTTGQCSKSISWEDVRRLYDFDLELRNLVANSVSIVEIAFREKFAYCMEFMFGRYWQNDEDMFKLSKGNRSVYNDIQCWISLYCAKGKCSFRELLDEIDWGKAYRVFSRLSPEVYKVKERIAREMGIPSVSIFSSVIFSLIELRNDCAHVRQIWDARYTHNPDLLYYSNTHLWLREPERVQLDKIYYRFCLLNYFHQVIDPDSTFRDELLDLLKDLVPLREMGFPEDWTDEPMWQRGKK